MRLPATRNDHLHQTGSNRMPVPLDQFVKLLKDSGVLPTETLTQLLPPNAIPQDADELARELIRRRQLSKFQAGEILRGKGQSLTLGNYILLDRLGAGGMGQVFKARHRRMDRTVALKVMSPDLVKDQVAVERFGREVKAAARLTHPNIVTAYDADQAGQMHFLVMEYVEGDDLAALVKRAGPLPIASTLEYIRQAANGLQSAHQHGIVHRDVKPANLLLDNQGTVKILDLGLARFCAGDGSRPMDLTATGTVMGTVDFMAPEQARSTKHADARADIYSLGCTLFYLLTGKAAYAGGTLLAKLMAHREAPIPSIRAVRPDVPESVEAVFRKMVAKKVEERYQSMSAVMEDLVRCQTELARDSAPSHPPVAQKTAQKTWNMTTKVAGIIFGTILAPVLATFIVKWLEKSVAPAAPQTPAKVVQADAPDPENPQTNTIKPQFEAEQAPAEIPAPSPIPARAIAPFDEQQARVHQEAWASHLGTQVETTNSIGMKLVLIPPGEFLMGSSDDQADAAISESTQRGEARWIQVRIEKGERPQHRVELTEPMLMSATEVTIGQFQQFVEATNYVTLADTRGGDSFNSEQGTQGRTWRAPSYPVTEEHPATQVAWAEAAAFCNWLCQHEKLPPSYAEDARDGWILLPGATGYRLPSEAQWEYACRAGTITQYSFGDDPKNLAEFGWYNKNTRNSARSVGLKQPNAFGLYDMHGNVWEWCGDWMDDKWFAVSPTSDPLGPPAGALHAVRGGSWYDTVSCFRSAFRRDLAGPLFRGNAVGFRVVRGK